MLLSISQDYKSYDKLQSGYQKALQGQFTSYLSPQQLRGLKENCHWNAVKGDVFALGMTLLELATRRVCLDCYNFYNGTINEQKIKQYQTDIFEKYSQCLLSFIQYLLTPSEDDRPTFLQLQELLSPYAQDIVNDHPFYHGIIICNCKDNEHFCRNAHLSPIKENNQIVLDQQLP